jgi:hypothetical protein
MCRRVLIRRVGILTCAATAACAVANFCGATHAAELWYDGFSLTGDGGDYVVDAPLNGAAGGSGSFFSGNWVGENPGDPASLWLSKGTGLSRPGLTAPPVGGAASNDVDFSCCVFGRTGRLFASPWGGFTDPDGTFYMGFLADFGTGNANDPHHRTIEIHDGGFDDNNNLTLELGIRGFTGGRTLEMIVRDSAINPVGNIGAAGNPQAFFAENANLHSLSVQGTHYVVLKFEMSTSGNDVISAFLDPVGNVEPTPSASVSVGQFLADRITFGHFTFNSGDPSAAGRYDELRVGTEFADVGINTLEYVPEPATLSLIGLALLGVTCGTRRRS